MQFSRSLPALKLLKLMAIGVILAQAFYASAGFTQMLPQGSPLEPRNGSEEDSTARDNNSRSSSPASPQTPGTASAFEPTDVSETDSSSSPFERRVQEQGNFLGDNLESRAPANPGEFEAFVSAAVGRAVPRFGADLLLPGSRDFAAPATATVPPEYVLNVGDTVVLSMNGSITGTVEREIDTDGNIFLPNVGSIHLAGVRYADLRRVVTAAIGREYRYFSVSVSVKSLRGIRVYVTGYANNPGAFTMSSLSTLVNAVFQAGGPNSGGSFRSVKVYRAGREIADFDLYTLLRGGNRDGDVVLQNEDVLFIPPAGELVAVVGSVEQEAIYELRPNETLAQALALAGGPNDLAEQDSMILFRTSDQNERGPQQLTLADSRTREAVGGDIISILSRGSLIQPIARQSVIVRVEGEVSNPGNYYVPPGTSIQDMIELAGGLTERAFLFGARLERRSVRDQQQQSWREAIEQLEFTIASAPLTASSTSNQSTRAAEMASAQQVVALLREREPDGRVIMNLTTESTSLPTNLAVEHQDRLIVPPAPTTVGVFGAVFRPASFLIEQGGLPLRDYIARAGGAQRAADMRRAFVVRANGEVLNRENGMLSAHALPGDVVFVPIRGHSNDFWQRVVDITSVIFQLGVTAAAINTIQ